MKRTRIKRSSQPYLIICRRIQADRNEELTRSLNILNTITSFYSGMFDTFGRDCRQSFEYRREAGRWAATTVLCRWMINRPWLKETQNQNKYCDTEFVEVVVVVVVISTISIYVNYGRTCTSYRGCSSEIFRFSIDDDRSSHKSFT